MQIHVYLHFMNNFMLYGAIVWAKAAEIYTPLLFEMIGTILMKSVHDKLLVSINFNFLNLFHKFWF